jgi:hypothetical protein
MLSSQGSSQLVDCTHTPSRCSYARVALLVAVSAGILALGSGWLAGTARADGDPASDVLASQALFLPQDAGVGSKQQAQLEALLSAAQRNGYQMRVAIIASPADLGSVTELWHQPRNYARFLGQELSLVYRGRLLVVMPNGYGLDQVARPPGAEHSALAVLGAPGARLGPATLSAVQHLAAASGHHLALPGAAPPSTARPADTRSWIALGAGGALILLAWTGSLRARPVQIRSRRLRQTE